MRLAAALVMILAEPQRAIPSGPAQVPAPVLQELQNRGCKLPKKKFKGIIIHGGFFGPGQSDWAALCTTKDHTSLLLFPNGSRETVVALETRTKGFAKWSIYAIDQEPLNSMKSTQLWKGPKPTEIDHQGIGSFVEFGVEDARCVYCYSAEGRTYYYSDAVWLKPLTMIAN